VLLCAAQRDEPRAAALMQKCAELIYHPNASGKVDLPAVLAELGQRGINEVHVEAGAALSGSFVREGLVDEFLVYLAPKLLGAGRDLATLGPFTQLSETVALEFCSVERIGDDLRILARPRTP
jgi:diaminohydroxyphosphoribosylaminopyrimidine deaminase/5-amino-6-(5-phosphoribosylamino)uracil reductase